MVYSQLVEYKDEDERKDFEKKINMNRVEYATYLAAEAAQERRRRLDLASSVGEVA